MEIDKELSELTRYSKEIGNNPLLVQGAGGNVSLKLDGSMWIKASGTWIGQAEDKNIFVELDLDVAKRLTEARVEDYGSAVRNSSGLRPSIETSLHVLLPHKVVSHFHAVDVLAWAVRHDGESHLYSLLAGINWGWIDYSKPGYDLTESVRELLRENTSLDVIVLGNHGIVIGANSFAELEELWSRVWERIAVVPREVSVDKCQIKKQLTPWLDLGYELPEDINIHALGIDPVLVGLCRSSWVLYPDHAVFLGAKCKVTQSVKKFDSLVSAQENQYTIVVIPNVGAVVAHNLSEAQSAMLSCYVNVGLRINDSHSVRSLEPAEVASLLNWDAEKYRQTVAR